VVNSTLAGETGSCCDCLGELEWLQCLWRSYAYTDFDIKTGQRRSRPIPTIHEVKQVLSKDNIILSDPQALVVTDAKSLYDHLSKESQGGQDRRTGLELAVVRDSLCRLRGVCRWVPHDRNPTDGLTKVFSKSNMTPMLKLMRSGLIKICSEADEMMSRAKMKEEQGYIPRPKSKTMFVSSLLNCFTSERDKSLSMEFYMSLLFEESYRGCAGEDLVRVAKELRIARNCSSLVSYHKCLQ